MIILDHSIFCQEQAYYTNDSFREDETGECDHTNGDKNLLIFIYCLLTPRNLFLIVFYSYFFPPSILYSIFIFCL